MTVTSHSPSGLQTPELTHGHVREVTAGVSSDLGGESQEASSRKRGPHLLAGGTATGHAGHTLGPMIQEKGPHTVPERSHQMMQSQEHVAGSEGCGAEGHVGGCIRDHGGRGGRRWGARTF